MSNADPPIRFPARQDGALHTLAETQVLSLVQIPPAGGSWQGATRWEEAAPYRFVSVFVRYVPLLAGGGVEIYPEWFADGPAAIGAFADTRIDPTTGQAVLDSVKTPPSVGLATEQHVLCLLNPGGCQWLRLWLRESVHAAPNNGSAEVWLRAGG